MYSWIMRPPTIAYYGAKRQLAPTLVSMMPKADFFVDVYAGRGNVTWAAMTLGDFSKFWINDPETAPFFKAILTHGHRIQPPSTIPAMRRRYDQYLERKKAGRRRTVESILLEPLVSRDGGGIGLSGPVSTGNVSPETFKTVMNRCHRLMLKMKPVVTAKDWKALPWKSFGADDFVFLDPPYFSCDVRSYPPLPDADYPALVTLLTNARFKWMLTEYEQPFYMKAFGQPVYMKTKQCGFNGSAGKRTEMVWTNYPVSAILPP